MRSGDCEPNLETLIDAYDRPHVSELIERKAAAEKAILDPGEGDEYRAEVEALLDELDDAFDSSSLPESPQAADDVEAFLIRVRMATS